MLNPSASTDRQQMIHKLLDDYLEMYATRDDKLTQHFSHNFSGYTGSGDFLVKNVQEWIEITRQDFSQVKPRINIEVLDKSVQDISNDVVIATAFFHIHLPEPDPIFSKEVARLVLVFRQEQAGWKIVHSGISIPYSNSAEGDEVYPLKSLQKQNSRLTTLVEERTQALKKSEALYRQLTEDTLDVHWKVDADFHITYISPSDETLRGFKAEEMIGHSIFEMFTPQSIQTVKQVIKQRAENIKAGLPLESMAFEAEHYCKDGKIIWGEVFSRPDCDENGNINGYHGITREITNRKLLEEKINQLAFYDSLTKLANRRLLLDRLETALSISKRNHNFNALLFLDLDNFKPLNDLHGHEAGDLLLVEVAHRLNACVREMDTVSRFGGDEFIVLIGHLSTDKIQATEQTKVIVNKIHQSLSEVYLINMSADDDNHTIEHHCSASIGVVVFNEDELNQNQIIERADSAMYLAKESGRNQIRFYDELSH